MAGANLFTAYIEMGFKGFDKVDKYMKDAVKSVQSGMNGVNSIFSAGSQAIFDFNKSASPAAINTFNSSVEVLKAQIGKEFTPYILMASKGVQDLQGWIAKLDPETKKQIASFVMWGVAGAGTVVVVKTLNDSIGILCKNPLAIVFTAIGMAAIKLAIDIDRMVKSMDAAIERGERMKKGIYTEKEHKGTIADAILNDDTMTKDQKMAKAKEMHSRLTEESHGIAKDFSNDTFGKQALTTISKGSSYLFGTTDYTNVAAKKMEGNNKEIKLLEDAMNKLESGEAVKYTDESKIPKKATPDNRLKLGAMGGTGGGASIGSLDSSYNNLNKLGLGQNETQQDLLRIQQESYKKMQEMAGDTGDLKDMMARAMGL